MPNHYLPRLGNQLSLILTMLWFCIAVQAETHQALGKLAFYPEHKASATAISLNDAVLSAQLLATVERIHVGVGEAVKEGKKLVTLDCSDYQLAEQMAAAQLKSAEARLSLARSQRKRNEQLLAKSLTSQEQVDTSQTEAIAREAELEQAKISLSQAALKVSRCDIVAPFDGIVTERNIAKGQLATVGSPLVTLVETSRLDLSAALDPSDLPLLSQSRELYFDYGSRLPVRILQLGGVVNSSTRSQEVRFAFTAAKPPPGTAGKLVWKDPRPFLPANYIISREGRYGVFINEGGLARFVPLKDPAPGRSNPVDLPLDTLIITEGLGTLKTGDAL